MGSIPATAAGRGAVAALRVIRLEQLAAPRTFTRREPKLASTMRVKSGCTVRADHAEGLDAIVVTDSVDVIKDQRHPAALPDFALPAELADRLLQSFSK